ncbi:hypothetical protein CTI12_AA617200 [Artemisia annua]|uniref:DUF7803 domain-containing protein n=1 Tax=Artemisia annua TaxID=35608 RepID=A0A2U1KD29_ARTAN|nr:hypothetical protein CTI12_AA617200 [Artemisia annua]
MNRLGHTSLEHKCLQTKLKEVLHSQGHHVIKLILALIQQPIPFHSPHKASPSKILRGSFSLSVRSILAALRIRYFFFSLYKQKDEEEGKKNNVQYFPKLEVPAYTNHYYLKTNTGDLTGNFLSTVLSLKIDAQPMMEETILVGDDLMLGPPSPVIPPEIADHDKELRQRLQDSEYKLGLSMPLDLAKERATQLESKTTTLERHLILASGIEGADGFRQRWSLHGRLTDTKHLILASGIEGADGFRQRWSLHGRLTDTK